MAAVELADGRRIGAEVAETGWKASASETGPGAERGVIIGVGGALDDGAVGGLGADSTLAVPGRSISVNGASAGTEAARSDESWRASVCSRRHPPSTKHGHDGSVTSASM